MKRMRLIDADAMSEYIWRKYKELSQNAETEGYGRFIEIVKDEVNEVLDEQPTVYDVDRAIQEIEKELKDAEDMLRIHKGTGYQYAEEVRRDSYKKALKIIKAGGIDE